MVEGFPEVHVALVHGHHERFVSPLALVAHQVGAEEHLRGAETGCSHLGKRKGGRA